MNNHVERWHLVDALEQPDPYVQYLALAHSHPQFKQLRETTYKAIQNSSGKLGIDAGCGIGAVVHELKERGWDPVGIDYSSVMIEKARQRYPGNDFRVGSITELPFADGSIDFYRSERVYIHLTEQQAEQALREAFRVLKPGGKIVLADPDLDTIAFTCSKKYQDIYASVMAARVNTVHNGRSGSNLRGLLVKHGFSNVTVSAHTLVFTDLQESWSLAMALGSGLEFAVDRGYITGRQAALLQEDISELDRQGAFQLSCTLFVVSGSRP